MVLLFLTKDVFFTQEVIFSHYFKIVGDGYSIFLVQDSAYSTISEFYPLQAVYGK